jgi:6-phosphofructokinase 1
VECNGLLAGLKLSILDPHDVEEPRWGPVTTAGPHLRLVVVPTNGRWTLNLGVVTSGGDSPGMNAAVRAVVRQGVALDARMIGFRQGFQGIIDVDLRELDAQSVSGILDRGGTWLGSGRCPQFTSEQGVRKAIDTLHSLEIEGLVVIGGDGSLKGAHALNRQGLRAVVVPATIDNDIYGTEATIGYDTCLNTILDAVSRIRDTASAHDRLFVLEVMGRDSGELALNSALAGGAEVVAIPETGPPWDVVREMIEHGHQRGKLHILIIVAEGSLSADEMAQYVSRNFPGREVRRSVLGHIQRGGRPSARDCIIASRMGARAVTALVQGGSDVMVGLQGEELVLVSLAEAISRKKEIDLSLLDLVANLAR